jgi:hypothetical protein
MEDVALLNNSSGDLLQAFRTSEYCVFICHLILLSAQRLRATRMTWFQQDKVKVEGMSLSKSFIWQTRAGVGRNCSLTRLR